MSKNLKDSYKDVEDFFDEEPSISEKSWGVIHDFYHYVLTHMEKNGITKTDLAKRINKSKASVTQMFNKNPNVSVRKLVEIADAIDLEISIRPIKYEDRAIEEIQLLTYTTGSLEEVKSNEANFVNFDTIENSYKKEIKYSKSVSYGQIEESI